MTLRYKAAVMSFCPDLTSSTAQSIPVGVLLLGRGDGRGIAAVATRATPPEGVDPLSAQMLRRLAGIVRDLVDAQLRESEEYVDIDAILRALERSLRNSLHVSRITDEFELDADADAHGNANAAHRVMEEFEFAIRTFKERRPDAAAAYRLEPDPGFFGATIEMWPLMTGGRESHA